MTNQHTPLEPPSEYQGGTLDSFSEQLQEDITRIWNQRYQDIFTLVQKIIAHPHTTITEHDMHRAAVIISFISGDDELTEYVYSLLTTNDVEKTKQIRKFVLSNTHD